MEFNIPHLNLSWSKKSFLDLEINNSIENSNTIFKENFISNIKSFFYILILEPYSLCKFCLGI